MISESGLKTEFLMIELYKQMTSDKIEYRDTGKVARDKINAIIDEVKASIPSIWENGHWYIWDVDTWITAVWLELREENNLIKQDVNSKTFTDLQLTNWLTPTSVFPIWVNIGNVSSTDWWDVNGVLLNAKATNGNYIRWLYGEDGNLYFDGWRGVFKKIPTNDDITSAIETLRNELSTVAYTGKSSDLDNDALFTSDNVLTNEEYEALWPSTWSDDRRYFTYKTVTKN